MAKSAALIAAEAETVREREKHLRDLNLIFSHLRDESESRGWCEEYEDFVDSLVGRLTLQPTEGVTKEWELDVHGKTVKVRAATEERALEKLHSFLDDYISWDGVLDTE